jgi:hypothetical protein
MGVINLLLYIALIWVSYKGSIKVLEKLDLMD